MGKPTPQQTQAVIDTLANMEAYLRRLGERIAVQGVREPHCLPKWVSHAETSVGGLRVHFAEWAKGHSTSPFAHE